MDKKEKKIEIKRFSDLKAEFEKVFLLVDKGVLSLIIDTVIANQMDLDPVWLFLIAPSSGGKSFRGDTPILMANGHTKKAKDIKIGDILVGDDLKSRTVLATHSGKEMMYEIEQKTADNYTVNESHILSLKYNNKRNEFKGIKYGDIIDIELKDYLKKSDFFKNTFKGFKVRATFKSKKVPLDPYFTGIYLGDGHKHNPHITNPDIEITKFLKEFSKKEGFKVNTRKEKNKNCNLHSLIKIKKNKEENKLWTKIKELKLNTKEFIPDIYKINNEQVQLQILAGLLDTDGYLDKRQRFEFVSKSKQLAEDIVFISRSLGFSTKIHKIKKGIKRTGFTGIYYKVYIIGDTYKIPTKIKRKQAKKRTYKRNILSTSINIKKKKIGKYYGFKVNGNGRFLLGDFTVTHNSELITALNDIEISGQKLIYPISDLTTNTFASGQKKVGKETSLLHKMPPGAIMTFKDFTSMLSKNREARAEILGQLREIYDKEYTKRTGTGDDITWRGKVGAIAGATEIIYDYQEDFSAMGDRFIMYSIQQPERRKLLDFVMKNKDDKNFNKDKLRQHLKDVTKSYIEYILANFQEEEAQLSKETKEDIIDVADFCTLVRSGVVIDKRKGLVEFVPAVEMPTRMIDQLLAIASATLARKCSEPLSGGSNAPHNKGQLTLDEREVLYKIAFDSIPLKRRMALKKLAQYVGGITTKGLAMAINYQTPVVQGWLSQLNGLGICTREAKGGAKGDLWILNPKYRDIMVKFEKIKIEDGTLENDDCEEEDIEESWKDTEVIQESVFDSL